jgi:hypothetical protein
MVTFLITQHLALDRMTVTLHIFTGGTMKDIGTCLKIYPKIVALCHLQHVKKTPCSIAYLLTQSD